MLYQHYLFSPQTIRAALPTEELNRNITSGAAMALEELLIRLLQDAQVLRHPRNSSADDDMQALHPKECHDIPRNEEKGCHIFEDF